MTKFRLQSRKTTTIEQIYEVEAENVELACQKLHFGGNFEAIKEFNEEVDYTYPKVI